MLYGLKLLLICIITVPAALIAILVGLFDPSGNHVHRITRFWSRLILAIGGVGLKVRGLSQLDPKRQYVFMVNHQSHIDIPVLVQSLRAFQLRWIAKRELLWVPFFGWAMWAAKHITVNRSDRFDALGGLKKAKDQMKGGISLVFFPEGTRSSDGNLLPFKRGGFLLAVKTRTPMVPITIRGSSTILPKGDWRIRGGRIEVTVGAPVAVEHYRPGNLRFLALRVQEAIESNLQIQSQRGAAEGGNKQSTVGVKSSLEKRTV
ncbi:MAG TPA: lysophospholipid acyltransferase family protein [Candidatus Binatia bacterium]|nr:lysophospholipid acyltransferase family protein [Candidatus Binatia bacterium]